MNENSVLWRQVSQYGGEFPFESLEARDHVDYDSDLITGSGNIDIRVINCETLDAAERLTNRGHSVLVATNMSAYFNEDMIKSYTNNPELYIWRHTNLSSALPRSKYPLNRDKYYHGEITAIRNKMGAKYDDPFKIGFAGAVVPSSPQTIGTSSGLEYSDSGVENITLRAFQTMAIMANQYDALVFSDFGLLSGHPINIVYKWKDILNSTQFGGTVVFAIPNVKIATEVHKAIRET